MALAKISRPNARIIGRRRIMDALEGKSGTIVWLVAPAGSGKTSFCIEYSRSRGGLVAWLRLDESDVDPASFFYFLEQAVICGRIAGDWRAPQMLKEHLPALHGYIRLFVRSLVMACLPNACLVIDDVHKCQDTFFFGQFLEILGEELRGSTRVLLCSRALPPENCARLLAHGRMVEIGGATLAFSMEETGQLLRTLGIPDAGKICATVFEYSRGWAVGIVLVASLLRRRPEALSLGDARVPRLVGDYLATEVFSAFSGEEQRVLLSICFLPYFHISWAEILTGLPQARQILTRLAEQGGLIYEYSGRQLTLHPLFQIYLREVAETMGEAETRLAWITAGMQLLEEQGDIDASIELGLAHGLHFQLASLIEKRAPELHALARHQTLARWIDALPEELRGAWHHYWLGLSIFTSDPVRGREALLKAYEIFMASGNRQHRFLALTWIIISYAFSGLARQPLSEILAWLGDADQDYEQLRDDSLKAHLALSVFSGLVMTESSHPDFELWKERALAALRHDIEPTLKIRIVSWLAIHGYFAGHYRYIGSLHKLLGGMLQSPQLPGYARYIYHYVPLMDALLQGKHDALKNILADSKRCAEETGICNLDRLFQISLAISRMLQGDVAGAEALLTEVGMQTPATHYYVAGQTRSVRFWLSCWQGDAVAALEYARMVCVAGENVGGIPLLIWGRIGICIATCILDAPESLTLIEDLRRLGKSARYPLAIIHADLLLAWLRQRRGDEEAAAVSLSAAFSLLSLESDGYLAFGIPHILQPLCDLALRRQIEPRLARSIVRHFRLAPPADMPCTWHWPLLMRCFGNFELLVEGQPMVSRGKTKHRQLDLLKLLAAHAPAPLSLIRIAEILWPESEGDVALHALETTVGRIRSTFGMQTIRIERGMASLERSACWLDTMILDERMSNLETEIAHGATCPAEAADAVLELYRGSLFADDSAQWLLPRREYWCRRVARFLAGAANLLIAAGKIDSAIRFLQRAVETDPYSETLIMTLMHACLEVGRYAEGIVAFRSFCRISVSSLGIPVPHEIKSLALQLQRRANTRPGK